ncbi:MAG: hypothetical protein HY275_00410 [Gemmatimonadetes bacterium]|nr:hypothetical protein [Gemmatimonadota bacterium]
MILAPHRLLRFVLLSCAGVALGGAPSTVHAQEKDTTALEVKAFRVPGDEPGFELNRPAYVAVFELRPGDGVAQLYPDNTDGSRTTSARGRTYLQAGRAHYNRQVSRAQFNYAPTSSFGTDQLRTGRTILVIASDRPLRVGAPAATAQTLRRIERLRTLRSGRILLEDLLAVIEAVKPQDAGAEVASDSMELPPG